jgi:flavodoxin
LSHDQLTKVALLYGSTHGRTRKVVAEALQRLAVRPEVFDVKDSAAVGQVEAHSVFLLFAPNYGDGELQVDMEEFIRQFSPNLAGKHFVICELGGYIEYENLSFGAMPILRKCLMDLGGSELCAPLSLDSIPRINWEHFYRWIEYVNDALSGYGG